VNGVEDPGWRSPLGALIPFVGLRTLRRRGTDGLTALRGIIVGLITALVLFIVALSYVVEVDGDPALAPAVVIAVGLLSHLAIGFLARRRPSTNSLRDLGDSWRTRMFTGVGLAELPGLVGVAAALISDTLWVYLIGMMFALAGFWRIAPSKRGIKMRSVPLAHRSTSPKR
jgi:hypothetical protein